MTDSYLANALTYGDYGLSRQEALLRLCPDFWDGFSGSYQEICLKTYSSSGTRQSKKILPDYFTLSLLAKFTASTSFWIANSASSSQNGYKIYFPDSSSVKLDRYDGGVATNLLNTSLMYELSSDYNAIIINVLYDRIDLIINGQCFRIDDTAHRRSDWYLYIVHSADVYLRAGHLVKYTNGEPFYCAYVAALAFWNATTFTEQTPAITFNANFDVKLKGLLLPKTGFAINITGSSSLLSKDFAVIISSPDSQYGLQFKISTVSGNRRLRIYDMSDTLLATSSDNPSGATLTIATDTSLVGASITATAGLAAASYGVSLLMPNMLLRLQDLNSNAITLYSVYISYVREDNNSKIASYIGFHGSGSLSSSALPSGMGLPSASGSGGLL